MEAALAAASLYETVRRSGSHFRSVILGQTELSLEKRLFVFVKGDEIVVTSSTGFRAAYLRRPNRPQLIVWRRTETDDEELLAKAWQAANAKARELGWIF
jgi:hypothetical protein